jgi:putative chitinase
MSLIKLQEKIGVTPDGSFGPKTLKAAATYFKLTPEEAAHFFGQLSHETGGFHLFTENLNYSAAGLMKVFGKYFTSQTVNQYARQPIKIASRVYANRMGNGDEASQEGWKYRGRGAIQLTGKANYQAFANAIGNQNIMSNPDLVATDYAFESAKFYFDKHNLWDIAKQGVNSNTILKITKAIVGGTRALKERTSLVNRYYGWLKS